MLLGFGGPHFGGYWTCGARLEHELIMACEWLQGWLIARLGARLKCVWSTIFMLHLDSWSTICTGV